MELSVICFFKTICIVELKKINTTLAQMGDAGHLKAGCKEAWVAAPLLGRADGMAAAPCIASALHWGIWPIIYDSGPDPSRHLAVSISGKKGAMPGFQSPFSRQKHAGSCVKCEVRRQLWFGHRQEQSWSLGKLEPSPGWCGSVGWASSHKLKGRWLDSSSGHAPELRVRSPVTVRARGNQSTFLTSVLLSLPLSLESIEETNIKNKNKAKF